MLSNYVLDKRIRELQKIYDAPKGKEIFKLYGNTEFEDFIAIAQNEISYYHIIISHS